MNDTDVAARLAEALWPLVYGGSIDPRSQGHAIAALLPVVREIADQRAAEELDTAAEAGVVQRERTRDAYVWDTGRDDTRAMLRARAAALRGATDG